jgi:hypothetical protein
MVGQRHAPAALAPRKARSPLCRRLVGSQGRSGRFRKILHPPRFDPRTVQPVASRYTNCAIPANVLMWGRNQLVKCYLESFRIQVTTYEIIRQSVTAEARVRLQAEL